MLASWLAGSGVALSCLTACATNDGPGAAPDERADAQTLPGSDGGGDASSEACADGGACSGTVDCSAVDFCATPFPVSRLVALNAIWGSGPKDVWAVGTGGTILHGDGNAFVPVATGPSGSTDIYVSIWGTSNQDIWIIGPRYPLHSNGFDAGKTDLEPRPGSSWNPGGATTGRLWTGLSAGGRVWIAGEESARFGLPRSSFWSLGDDSDGGLAWTGAPACTDAQPCAPAIRGAWSADATSAWAVGHDGQAFVLDAASGADGGAARWLGQNSNTRNDLESVWGSGPNDVWAVGRHGTIRHTRRGDSAWTVTPSPTTRDLHAVWGSAPGDVWAAGDGGTILHFDGKAWSLATLGLPNGDLPTNLFAIWGSGPDDVWIAGEGLILHHTATSRRRP